MQQTLRLLGTTAAMHHVILRAPVAGRVLGMNLKIGDRVHKGQTVAHVLSLEIEAARQGLGVAKKIDPQDAASLEKSVNKYSVMTTGFRSSRPKVAWSPRLRSPADRSSRISIRSPTWSIRAASMWTPQYRLKMFI